MASGPVTGAMLARMDPAARQAFLSQMLRNAGRSSTTGPKHTFGSKPRALTASVAPADVQKPTVRPVAVQKPTPATTVPKAVVAPRSTGELSEHDAALLAVCCHEAGHAVAGVLLGGQVHVAAVGDKNTVPGTDGSTGFVAISPTRRDSMVYSGPWAETRWLAGRCPRSDEVQQKLACGRGHAHSDHSALTASGAAVFDLHAQMGGLMERCWPAVVTVAKQLVRSGEVGHKDVCTALGLTVGRPDLHAFELNNIRAGLRNVPASAAARR